MNLLLPVGGIVAIAIGGVVFILIVAIVAWAISAYNKFVQMRNQYEEAWATIDVYLKKRFDLLPNLVETVKGYAKHESQTLESVIQARNTAQAANTPAEKIEANAQLSQAIKNFNLVVEKYPELKANTNFLDLQNQLKSLEAELVNARKYYNGSIKVFNTRIQTFPSNFIANMMKLEKQPYFELDSEEERKNVKVSF